MTQELPSTSRLRTFFGYATMVAVTAAVFFFIRARGEKLVAPAAADPVATEALHDTQDVVVHVLLALAAITLLARIMGALFRRLLGQPPVLGEIVAGLMLGPSLLGAISPEGYAFLMPADSAPYLGLISKLGVVLFMFLVGLDLDPKALRGNTHSTVAISHASIVAPFLLGTVASLGLYSSYATRDVSFTVFSLFIGVSMSVTAFPVLARILVDRGVQHTPLGTIALTCAAVDDVTAWSLLALVAGVAKAEVDAAAWTIVLVIVYITAMVGVVRPVARMLLNRLQPSGKALTRTTLAAVFGGLLLSAVATEAIGIHALFGAFLFGAVLPREGTLAEEIRTRLEDAVLVLFLPSFFAFTGMRTSIGLVSSAQDWLVCLLIIVVATVGKFGGTLAAARLTGLGWRKSAALGVLMNTRGLMQLVVLNVGLDLGMITPTIFAMMVIMALVTTFATTPILDLLLGKAGFAESTSPEFIATPRTQRKL